ncbi:MAG: NADH-quinone oxidoreductase subunit C [Nitrososphaerota archaeon]|nr:NADH-quinone oxidoreductase subunit C [Nitrososphaerota archaeon]MDG6924025.1 NADH-quinone oxidoreductase subunit C [Nitrososphaerota archaeon]
MSTTTAPSQLPTEEKAIIDSVATLGERVTVLFSKRGRIKLRVTRENLIETVTFVRDVLRFDHCTNVTGTDFPKDKQLEVTYHFGSIEGAGLRRVILAVSCRVPASDPVLSSIMSVYPSANFHERETAEMIGCIFQGHPNLGRLLLPEDWNDIPPMLKAYRLPGRLEES